MVEEVVRICGVALLCAFTGAAIGKLTGGVAAALRIGGLALVLGGAIALMSTLKEQIEALGAVAQAAEYASLLLKALGIAFLCRICSDVCGDCGERTLGAAVETVGKLAIVGLSMPAVGELISLARDILDRI